MSQQQSMFSPQEPRRDDGEQPEYHFHQSTQYEKLRPRTSNFQFPKVESKHIFALIALIVILIVGAGILSAIVHVLISGLTSLFIIAIVVGVFLLASSHSESLPTEVFTVGEHVRLNIHTDAGSIRIVRGESGRVEVRGKRTISNIGRNYEQDPIAYTQQGDTIKIHVQRHNLRNWLGIGAVSLEIHVPSHSELHFDTNAGTLHLAGVSGHIKGHTNAGTIHVENAVLTQGSSLKTNAGTIHMERTTLHTDTVCETNAGTIHLTQSALHGRVSCKTNAGSIHYDGSLNPSGDYQFKTDLGSIHMDLPADSAFNLVTSTSMGSVRNEFGSNKVGVEPMARLQLRTEMGSIHITRK